MGLTEEFKGFLTDQGVALVGIGDMRQVEGCRFPVGAAVAVPLPKTVIMDLQTAPTKEYEACYRALNQKLDTIVMAGEEFLRDKGFEAYAQTTDRVKVGQGRVSLLPHKTVAARAGLGWIGKNCLLVTAEYGPAVRISSLLTNAPLICDEPITHSRCGDCGFCVKACPAQALTGALWEAGMPRDEIVDVEKCYKKQIEIMVEHTRIKKDLCGKCFAVCAYTQRYLHSEPKIIDNG